MYKLVALFDYCTYQRTCSRSSVVLSRPKQPLPSVSTIFSRSNHGRADRPSHFLLGQRNSSLPQCFAQERTIRSTKKATKWLYKTPISLAPRISGCTTNVYQNKQNGCPSHNFNCKQHLERNAAFTHLIERENQHLSTMKVFQLVCLLLPLLASVQAIDFDGNLRRTLKKGKLFRLLGSTGLSIIDTCGWLWFLLLARSPPVAANPFTRS